MSFLSNMEQGFRKVQVPYLKHLAGMAKDPKQAWRLGMPGDNETTKLTNKLTGRDDKPWQGSFSEGLGLPSWYKDEVRARGDGTALGYDHQAKGITGAVVAAFLGGGAFNGATAGAGSAGTTAGSTSGAGASGAGTAAGSSSPSWMQWARMGAGMASQMGGGQGGAGQYEAPDVAGDFERSEERAQQDAKESQATADAALTGLKTMFRRQA